MKAAKFELVMPTKLILENKDQNKMMEQINIYMWKE